MARCAVQDAFSVAITFDVSVVVPLAKYEREHHSASVLNEFFT
jgi:hypothetical protein